ncbi:MAG: aromatic-ring-hydroxylating dioxygenase subunit beta, partial [Stellaceae bacterium]
MSDRRNTASATREEVEEFLYREAALLDAWQLDDWLALTTADCGYYVPPNDKPGADHRSTLFTVADDHARLIERVKRLKDPSAHAEYPPSRTRRLISNVRVTS